MKPPMFVCLLPMFTMSADRSFILTLIILLSLQTSTAIGLLLDTALNIVRGFVVQPVLTLKLCWMEAIP